MCIKGIHFASISTFSLLDFRIALTPDGVVFSPLYYFLYSVKSECPDGFFHNADSCYLFSVLRVSWIQAMVRVFLL